MVLHNADCFAAINSGGIILNHLLLIGVFVWAYVHDPLFPGMHVSVCSNPVQSLF